MRALMSLCVGRAAECTIRRHVYNAGWNLLAILVLARLLVALCEGLCRMLLEMALGAQAGYRCLRQAASAY